MNGGKQLLESARAIIGSVSFRLLAQPAKKPEVQKLRDSLLSRMNRNIKDNMLLAVLPTLFDPRF